MPQRRGWVYDPGRAGKPHVPDDVKAAVDSKCEEFIEEVLKPRYMVGNGRYSRNVRLVEMPTKWFSTFFYFRARFQDKRRNAISPEFEKGFARLEYVGKDRFNLSYMRYTGKWWVLEEGLTLEECLDWIGEGGIFEP